jgi:hypothetical protein
MSLPTEANVTQPLAYGYAWLLEYGDTNAESLYLRPGVGPGREQRIQTVEPKEGPDTETSPEELRGESGRSFARSGFSGGEGLDRAYEPDLPDRHATMYWDSRNINVTPGVAGNPDEIQLLHAAANIRADDAGNSRMPLVRIGTVLYMCCSDDNLIDRTSNPTAATPTFTTEDPHDGEGAQDILDLAALGNQLHVALGSQGIHQRATGAATWSHWSDVAAVRIWAAKGRILASTGAALYEAAATTGSTLLHTLSSGQTWTDVVDAGAAILAGASDGEVYAFVDEDGELALRSRFVFEGEQITALGAAQGFVFVGTGEPTTGSGQIGRLWRCQLVGLRFQGNQVIRQWGDGTTTLNRAPQRIINTREAVYTGVIDSATESHLWKYHLTTAGISRDLILNDGLVQGLAVVDDRLFATVFVEGLWREATTYASTGYLISPLADFYSAADKTWIDARLTTGTLDTDTDVVLAYSTNPDAILDSGHASWTTIISADHTAGNFGDLGPTFISEAESRYVAAKLTLTPNGAATSTPTVLAFALRGLFKPTEKDFAIPVNVSDRLEMPGRKPLTVPGAGQDVLDQLHEIEGKAVTLTDLRTLEIVDGQFRGTSTPIQGRSFRGSVPVYSMATVRGVKR